MGPRPDDGAMVDTSGRVYGTTGSSLTPRSCPTGLSVPTSPIRHIEREPESCQVTGASDVELADRWAQTTAAFDEEIVPGLTGADLADRTERERGRALYDD
jgi:hypothetical protein